MSNQVLARTAAFGSRWTLIHLLAAPLAGIALFLGLVFAACIHPVGTNPSGMQAMLAWMLPLGGGVGLVFGLLQALVLPLPVDFGGLYLPFLLFALPYVIVTGRLWPVGQQSP